MGNEYKIRNKRAGTALDGKMIRAPLLEQRPCQPNGTVKALSTYHGCCVFGLFSLLFRQYAFRWEVVCLWSFISCRHKFVGRSIVVSIVRCTIK